MVLVKCSHCGRESDQNQQEREIRSREKRGCPDCGQVGTERLVIREETELNPAQESAFWKTRSRDPKFMNRPLPEDFSDEAKGIGAAYQTERIEAEKKPEVPHGIRVGPGGTVQNKPKKKDGSS